MSKKSDRILTYSINIAVPLLAFVGLPILMMNWVHIKAFFAPTPYNKCVTQLKSADSYCSDDGSLRSHKEDKQNECQNKAPYFMWKKNGLLEDCNRIRYDSQSACINDGREGVIYDDGAPTDYRIHCLPDGTWKAYSSDPPIQATDCKDVTSYDYNWDNDMFCTRPDGSTFYTSYEGAQNAP